MKIRAICNVKHNAVWHRAGETFELDEKDLPALSGTVELVTEPLKAPGMEDTGTDTEPAKSARTTGRKSRKQTEE